MHREIRSAFLAAVTLTLGQLSPAIAQDSKNISNPASLVATATFRVASGSVCRIDPKSMPAGTISPIIPIGPDGLAHLYLTAANGIPAHDLHIGLLCSRNNRSVLSIVADIKSNDFKTPATKKELNAFPLETDNATGVLSKTKVNVVTASDQTLEHLGYPPRPNKDQAPEAYKLWLYMVTTPNVYQRPSPIAIPPMENPNNSKPATIKAAPKPADIQNIISLGFNNWAGAVVTTPNPFTEVTARWQVPNLYPPNTNLGRLEAAEWVGLNSGLGGPGVIMQTGLDGANVPVTDPFSSGLIYGANVYFGWYEYLPASAYEFGDLNFEPGDTITALVYLTSASSTPTAHFQVCNLTKQECSTSTANPPSGTTANLGTAEWIVERPYSAIHNGDWPLANFSISVMTNAAFKTTNAPETCINGPYSPSPQYYRATMTEDGTPNTPAQARGFLFLSAPPNTCMVDFYFVDYQ